MKTWRKSSYTANAGNCVEAAATWRTSSYANAEGGACVEVAETPQTVHVRDTKNRHLGHLSVPEAEWRAFLHALRQDEL